MLRNSCLTISSCFQIEKVRTIEDLSTRLSFRDTVNMHGREIHLTETPPLPASGVTPRPQVFAGHPGTPAPAATAVTWVSKDAHNALCWEMKQLKATLVDVTIRIPAKGWLIVHAASAKWRNVRVHGVHRYRCGDCSSLQIAKFLSSLVISVAAIWRHTWGGK